MSIKIIGYSGSNIAEVDSNHQVKVALASVINQSGYAKVVGESHDGTNGVAAIQRAMRISTDGRVRSGIDTLLWTDTFNHAINDTSKYATTTTTMTVTVAGGALNLNAGGSLAAAAVARVQTFRTFFLLGSSSLEVVLRTKFSVAPTANNIFEGGLGYAATTVAPTDGVFFRLNGAGSLIGVRSNNSSEDTVPLLTTPVPNKYYELKIVIDQNRAEFYVDGVCEGILESPDGISCLTLSRGLPILLRAYNSGVVTGSAQIVSIADVVVANRDLALGKSLPQIRSGMLDELLVAPAGATAGSSANYANSTGPVSATLSNTAAGYTTLGGQFQFAAPVGAETDFALFGFQVPAAAAAGGNKNAVITGIIIDTINIGAAVATTATVLQWAIGVGSTAVSLATADSATAAGRARRVKGLGYQSFAVGAAIGTQASRLDIKFDTPLIAEPGTWVHIIVRVIVGTATASQIIRGIASPLGYWE